MIVWVAPAGGFAASAGTFITLVGEPRRHGARARGSAPPRRSTARATTSRGPSARRSRTTRSPGSPRSPRRATGRSTGRPRPSPRRARRRPTEAVSLGRRRRDRRRRSTRSSRRPTGGRSRSPVTTSRSPSPGAPIDEAATNPLGGLLRLLADPNVAFLLFTVGALGPPLRAPEPEPRDRDPRASSRSPWRPSDSSTCRPT